MQIIRGLRRVMRMPAFSPLLSAIFVSGQYAVYQVERGLRSIRASPPLLLRSSQLSLLRVTLFWLTASRWRD